MKTSAQLKIGIKNNHSKKQGIFNPSCWYYNKLSLFVSDSKLPHLKVWITNAPSFI